MIWKSQDHCLGRRVNSNYAEWKVPYHVFFAFSYPNICATISREDRRLTCFFLEHPDSPQAAASVNDRL
ncbi:hypothetical protein DXA36_03025 [Eisenbergiella sp. OF01-20]|nr:hypothetical protein DXA36_03025 [Eisenbergiella sp. OF01-20]